MRRCGRACRRTMTARGLVPPTRATSARTAAARLRATAAAAAEPGSHSRRARRPGRLPRRSRERCRRLCPQSPTTTMSQASRAALPARSATVSTRWCVPASSRRPATPCTTSPVLPHVLDGRAVELEVDGRWIDAGAVVGRGHGDAQHVAVAERRAGFGGSGLPNAGGCRVGHREARAPDGAIADSVDGGPRRACALRRTAPLPAARSRGPRQAVRRRAQRRRSRMAIEAMPLAASEKASSTGGRVSEVTEPGAITPTTGGVRSIQHRERNAGRDLAAHVGAADGAVVDAVAERRRGQAEPGLTPRRPRLVLRAGARRGPAGRDPVAGKPDVRDARLVVADGDGGADVVAMPEAVDQVLRRRPRRRPAWSRPRRSRPGAPA